MPDDTLLHLLSGCLADPDDEFSRNVCCDWLEEHGYLKQKRILLGVCPLCGGKMRRPKGKSVVRYNYTLLSEPYFRCTVCKEDDVDHGDFRDVGIKVNRVIRELGFKRCERPAHMTVHVFPSGSKGENYQQLGVACKHCHSLGIVRK